MYRIADDCADNVSGTATLMEALSRAPVGRLVCASSMSVYGEGLYRDARGEPAHGAARLRADLEEGSWDPRGEDGPAPTPESKPCSLSSVYALTKYHQEQLCLIAGKACGIATVALRCFNTYGPRQALGNPCTACTGVLAIFAARLLQGRPPRIFEDGEQRRDFVSVHDVVRAVVAALGVRYGGFLPNHRVPAALSRARLTVHVPRRPYVDTLQGIPTIRPFEAFACGVPLLMGPWFDRERLFESGSYRVARTGREMKEHLRDLRSDGAGAAAMASRARRTLLLRHTCAHRVDELLAIAGGLS